MSRADYETPDRPTRPVQGKAKSIFERVYGEVNRRRGEQGGGQIDYSQLDEILNSQRIDKKDWYGAIARAKKQTPNLHELFYRAFRDVPAKCKTPDAPPAPQVEQAAEPEPETEPEAEAPDTEPPSTSDVVASIIGWLDLLTGSDRRRIIRTIDVYYDEDISA